MESKNTIKNFPSSILAPVGSFLKTQLKKLERTRSQIEKDDPYELPNRSSDKAAPDEQAEEQIGHMRSLATQISLTRRIIQTRRALSRVRIGKYGICENCSKMIDTDRLMIYPEATLCISCEKGKEKSKK